MTSSRWTPTPSVLIGTLLVAVLVNCGGGDATQGPGTDAVTLDAYGEAETLDAPTADEANPVDVQTPSACLTGQVCAADTDCNQGERCNLTLVLPQCQVLYCAKEAEACDPAKGDALCTPGLVCTGAPSPACCAPHCYGNACGSDGCGGSCGDCQCGESCNAGECIFGACEGRMCGDDGCDGSCGTCPRLADLCIDGNCVCQPSCVGRVCGDDGCDGSCGDCGTLEKCEAGQCVCADECFLGDRECVDGHHWHECRDTDDDSCGEWAPSKSCPATYACENGACKCYPDCTDLECGSDGCGGSCGSCASNETCSDGLCACKGTVDDDCDGVDDDCNGQTDEGYVPIKACFKPGACATKNVASSCHDGVETPCKTGSPAGADVACNGVDEDCDGFTDEDASCDDGDRCNGVLDCEDGECVEIEPPVDCAAQDACHHDGACEPESGLCSTPCVDLPPDTCEGTAALKHFVGVCSVVAGAAACDYPPSPVECTTTGTICEGGACVSAPRPTTAGQLVVTEFMARSQAGTDDGEWFELTNVTQKILDVGGCVLADDAGQVHTINGALLAFPGTGLVLAKSGEPSLNHGLNPDYVFSGFSLSNGGDEITLRCPTNGGGEVTVDHVGYATAWVTQGVAIQLSATKTNAVDNDLFENWCLSTTTYGTDGLLGSPGEPNAVCAP